jgi:hypothetical protein
MAGPGGVEVGRISIKVVPDTSGFKERVRAETAGAGSDVEIPVDADTAAAEAKIDRAARNRTAKIDVDVDENQVRRGFSRAFGNVDWSAIMPNFGTGINFAGFAVIAGLITAAFSPVLALLSGLTLAIPGLLAAVAAPIGAVALGLDGIKRAAGTLQEPFQQLKATIGDQFFAQLAPQFERLKPVISSLGQAFAPITSGIGTVAEKFTDLFTSTRFSDQLGKIFQNIGDAIGQAAPGLTDFTEGIMTLIRGLTDNMPGIVDWFNETAASFAKWISEKAQSGELDDWLDKTGETLKTIGNEIVKIIGKTLEWFETGGPEDLIAGLENLGSILQSIASISNFIGSTPFWQLLTMPGPLALAITNFEAIKGIFAVLPTLISGIVGNIGTVIGGAFSGLAIIVQTVVGQIISFFLSIPGAVAGAFAGIAGAAAGAMAGLVASAAAGIANFVATIIRGGVQAAAEVASWPGKFAAALGDLFSIGLNAAIRLGEGLVQGLAQAGARAVAKAKEIAGNIAGAIGGLFKFGSPSKLTKQYGEWTMEGFQIGMENGGGSLVQSARQIFQALKDVFGTVEGLNLNINLGGAATSMASMATSAGSINQSLSAAPLIGATDGSEVGPFTKDQQKTLDQIKQQSKLLDLEIQRLSLQKKQGGLNDAEAARLDELRLQRDQLKLQRDQLQYQKDYNSEVGNTQEQYDQLLGKALKVPYDFGMANTNKLMEDLNIGGGAITGVMGQLADWGFQTASNFIFNVQDTDSAIAIKNNQLNRQKQQYQSR